MFAAFEHIEQAQYVLARLFESGLVSAKGAADELPGLAEDAAEAGLEGGAEMLLELAGRLAALRADPGLSGIGEAAAIYSNLVFYYNTVRDMLIIEKMTGGD